MTDLPESSEYGFRQAKADKSTFKLLIEPASADSAIDP